MRTAMLLLLLLALPATAAAAPGDLDASFGTQGVFLGEEEADRSYIDELVRQPDGTFLALANGSRSEGYRGVVSRLLADGRVDRSFGNGGYVATLALTSDVLRQADGRIVAAGVLHDDPNALGKFAAERFLPNGEIDPSFGEGGRAAVRVGNEAPDPPPRAYAWAAAVDSQGRTVVVGTTYGGEGSYTVLVRFLSDGSLDASFGGTGVVRFRGPAFAPLLQPTVVRPLADGGLLLAGTGYFSRDPQARSALLRLRPDGSRDETFGRRGLAALPEIGPIYRRVYVRAGGKILALGARGAAIVEHRFLPDGRADRSFATDGSAWTELPTPPDADGGRVITDVLRLGDGKVLASGFDSRCVDDRGPCDFAAFVARVRRPGQLDSELGRRGVAITRLGGTQPTIYDDISVRSDSIRRLLLLPDERVIAAGGALRRDGRGGAYMLARFRDLVAPRFMRPVPRRASVRRRSVSLSLGCREAGGACAARVRFTARSFKRPVGNGLFALTSGELATVRVRIGRGARRRIAERGRLAVRALVRLRDANGNSLERTRRVVLYAAG